MHLSPTYVYDRKYGSYFKRRATYNHNNIVFELLILNDF